MTYSAVAIGWDVRGWRSEQQAVAVAAISDGELCWPGIAPAFRFETGAPVDFTNLTRHAVSDPQSLLDRGQVVISIDSPLAFPKALADLMAGRGHPVPTATEIENPLAYRDCDRRVAEAYGKKPLSAAFDRLGNTASLAMTLCQSLRSDGFERVPQDTENTEKAVIEVYPAVHKRGPRRGDPAIAPIHRLIPAQLSPDSDIYDAAICAILGLVFAGAGNELGLPDLATRDASCRTDEGWIFGLPPEFVR